MARPTSVHTQHSGTAHTRGPSVRPRPTAGRPTRAGSFAKEPPFFILFAKLTRALFHRVMEFASTTLLLFQFLFPKVVACPAKHRRARTSPAPTSTTMTLYVQRATDRGNKRHDWCHTETWPCTTAGFGRGDADTGEISSLALQLLPSLHY